MRRTRILAPALAPLLAATLFLGACGSDDDDSDAKDDKSSSASSEAPTDATDDSTENGGDDASNAGDGQTVTGAKSGVTFEVPADWEVIDPANADEVLDENGEEYAKSLGFSEDQLKQALTQLDTIVFGPERQNINAVPIPGSKLPSASDIEGQFASTQVKIGDVEEIDTPLGDALRATWSLPADAGNAYGEGIWVVADDNIINVTATVKDADTATKLMDKVVETIAAP